jgi:hypothetical protein
MYVAPLPPPEALNTTFVPRQTVAADLRVTVGAAGDAVTKPDTILEFDDWQVTVPYATCANAVTDLVPVVAPLTVNVPLPVPLAVPDVPGTGTQVYVAPSTGAITRNSTSIF